MGFESEAGPYFQRGLSLNGWLVSIMMRGVVIDMNDAKLQTLDQVRAFLKGTVVVAFSLAANERYEFVARTVRRFGYARLKRADKGVVLRFLGRVSGYSRQQLTRLVQRAGARAPLVKRYRASRSSFARPYTRSIAPPFGKENPCVNRNRLIAWSQAIHQVSLSRRTRRKTITNDPANNTRLPTPYALLGAIGINMLLVIFKDLIRIVGSA